jgi:hypothetical protein
MSIEINVCEKSMKKLIRTTKLIPRHLLAREAELMVAKWPAYRFLSPLEATKLFHAEYVEAYKAYYTTNIDYEEGQKIRIGSKLRFLMQNAHLTQAWKARQLADELGMPYPDYLEFEFLFAADRQREHAPQPNQLGPNEKTKDAWFAKLEAFWTPDRYALALNRMDPLPQYARDHDHDLPAQRRFREELIENKAYCEGALDGFVGRYVQSLRYLSVEDCMSLGAEAVVSALDRVAQDAVSNFCPVSIRQQPEPEAFLQSCFGVPGIMNDEGVCRDCPLQIKCAATRRDVLHRVKSSTGFEDPIDERRKRKNRERSARFRERKKQEEVTKMAT